MDTTSINCPSCNRKISIALAPPLCSLLPMDLEYSHIPSYSKEHTLKDILYVHEQLIEENKFLRKKLEDLHVKLYGKPIKGII